MLQRCRIAILHGGSLLLVSHSEIQGSGYGRKRSLVLWDCSTAVIGGRIIPLNRNFQQQHDPSGGYTNNFPNWNCYPYHLGMQRDGIGINGWEANEPDILYDPNTIFEYIDGAGEVYRAYNFQCLLARQFNKENEPKIKLNTMSDITQKDEQEGFRFIFMGVMKGIRNPIAHKDINCDDPVLALKYLCMISLLFEKLDNRVFPKE